MYKETKLCNGDLLVNTIALLRKHTGFLFLLLITTIVVIVQQCWNEDTWIHLASGKWIMTHGIPTVFPFSYVSDSIRWVDYCWLPQVTFYLIERTFGLPSLTILMVLVSWLLLTLVYISCLEESSPVLAAVVTAVVAVSIMAFVQVRPQIFSVLFFAGFAYILRYRDKYPLLLCTLPFIMFVWANTHIFFVLGLFLTFFYLIEDIIKMRRVSNPSPDDIQNEWEASNSLIILVLICLAVLIAPVLNPYGLNLYRELPSIISFGGGEWLTAIPGEFGPLTSRDWVQKAYIVLYISVLFMSKEKPSIFYLLLSGLFVYLSISQVKYLPYLIIFTAPELARHAWGLVKGWNFSIKKESYEVFLVLILIYLLGTLYTLVGGLYAHGWKNRSIPAIETSMVAELSGPLLNDTIMGGYLIYKLYPAQQVYVDTMFHLYPKEVLEEIRILRGGLPGWEQIISKYNPQTVLWRKESPLVELLKLSGWHLYYENKYHVILLKDSNRPEEGI